MTRTIGFIGRTSPPFIINPVPENAIRQRNGGHVRQGEKVPAEVSKRGVMIGNFEGALSSRRKRADFIIPQFLKKASPVYIFLYFFPQGCRLFLLTAEKGK
jgi:hypothetical protein